jgi:hypothetical protein
MQASTQLYIRKDCRARKRILIAIKSGVCEGCISVRCVSRAFGVR